MEKRSASLVGTTRLGEAAIFRRAASILLAVCFLAGAAGLLHAEIKDYVFIVKPVYHEKTRALFLDLAKYFADNANANAEAYFRAMAGEYAHGTGWVYVDKDGQNYLITNRHVVIGAEKVNIYQEALDGTQKAFLDCPILYVDTQMDLAVCQFPGAQKVYRTGFRLDPRLEKDLTEVVAAGFPGFGGKPLWQVSVGTITNSQARIDPAYPYLIQHSAPIDPGNSGGPLLVKDAASPIGYSVAGVNTLKALKRESTNFAIPAANVAEVLERARRAKALAASPNGLRGELVKSCTILAGELNSDNPVEQDVNQHISYAIVGEKGWQAYTAVLDSEADKKKFLDWFMDDPVEAMRTSVYWLFSAEVDHKAGTVVQFQGINPADEDKMSGQGGIRTTFLIGGTPKEIAWSMEYGQWRISDLSLPVPQKAAAAPAGAPAAGTASADSGQGTAPPSGAASTSFPVHSLLGGVGIASTAYFGIEYTGMIFPGRIGLSAAVGYAVDGSVFVIGGPALAAWLDVLFPLRIGVALTPYGTSIVVSPGVLLKLDVLAFALDIGYVFPATALFGVGLGVNF
jgi:S1-C subfamily serine protease